MILSITPLSGLVFFLFLVIIILSVYLINKLQTVAGLRDTVAGLAKTVQNLDHQAKLIIKSDIELKLYQEEVEDKLNKLTLLKNLIISSIHILDKEQLYSQIDDKIINDLGFKKGLIFNFDDLYVKANVGFLDHDLEIIKNSLTHKRNVLKGNFLFDAEADICKDLINGGIGQDVLIASIKARENVYAVLLLSERIAAGGIKIAEKEIITIICMYLGQCLDNIKLFEELYRTKDELEKKIKERTNELVKSLREIEVVSRAKSDFVSSVSHELRTPLTSVKGFSSLLVEEKFGKLPPEAKERLKKIDENVNKLVDMVNTLLDISRIESGRMEIKIAPCDIVKVIKETSDFLSPQLHAKEIKFNLDVPEALSVYMDKNLIERVLINLINNAIKFTPKAGMITISCKQEGLKCVVSVSDTGFGIEEENLEKIFQEFFRVDNPINREMRGTGLGLSLVKRIIENHKEKTWVASKVGSGTTFYFTLKLSENV
ncbi:MAG: HAMP domain-containing sensor histidine kinase [Candidatus Omnitrophica bacterium]|nr:HAMP domain-containing sensor histidine kinase [Candidatus Omnitrophota bacterium]